MGGLSKLNPSAVLGTFASDLTSTLWSGHQQNKANKEAQFQSYAQQVSLMNEQNAYNTPAAQMARYKEAGLNPNLIYGQSNLSASPSSVPQRQVSRYSLPSMLQAYVSLMSLENSAKEMELKSDQLDLAQSNAYDLRKYREMMLGATDDRLSFEKRKWNADEATRKAKKILLDKRIQALGQSISLMNNPLYRSGAPWWIQGGSRLLPISATDEALIDNYLDVAAGVR